MGSGGTGGGGTGGDASGGTASGGVGADAGAGGVGSFLVVDDFEDGDDVSLLGTSWYRYDDGSEGGESLLTVGATSGISMDGDGYESERSLLASYSLAQGTLSISPFVGLGVSLLPGYSDLSDYVALRYTYRGGAHAIRLESTNVEDYDYHVVNVPASPDWRTVEFGYDKFLQAGWGEPVPLLNDDVAGISWHVSGDDGLVTTLELDNVFLMANATEVEPSEPNLVIRPVAPPDRTVLDSLEVTHPLQALAFDALSRGYNITNFLEQDRFVEYGDYDEEFVKKLKAAGFRSLRLPIDFDLYIEARVTADDGSMTLTLHDDLFQILDDYDTWTEDNGLSLTIDYHQYDASFDIDESDARREFVELWRRVAEHFAGSTREDLFFELMNEPELFAGAGAPSAAQWGELATAAIDAIREHDSERPVIFGDIEWYGIDALVKRTPLDDPHVIYAFHFYDPFIFTHQGASWADMAATHSIPFPYSEERWTEHMEDFGFSELGEAWHLDQLRNYYRQGTENALFNRLALAKKWAVENNVPLVLNEFGVYEARSKQEDRDRYYQALTDSLSELEIPWQIWFMIMDPETGEVSANDRAALGL